MNETPEAIRDRVMQEELAKGSDPRVAEARSKAAEARAKDGLPIDPQQAWPLKLSRAGREVSAPAAAPATPEPEEPAPAPEPAETAEPSQQEAVPEPAAATPGPAPVEASPAPPTPVVEVAVPFDPEVGEPLEDGEEEVITIGGVQVRDSKVPAWLVAVLVLIPLWAAFYLIAIGTGDVERTTTGCVVEADRTFQCFQPTGEEATEQPGSGGH